MNREQLEHVLRAAAAIAQEKENMIDADTLDERIRLLDACGHPLDAIRAWARRRAAEARA